jgi:hypothetical protein
MRRTDGSNGRWPFSYYSADMERTLHAVRERLSTYGKYVMAGASQSAGASLSDLLSAVKNLVQAAGTIAQNYLNVQGQQSAAALTAPTIIKISGGRIARVSVIVAGSAVGTVYDGASLSATASPLYIIPNTVGVVEVNMPANVGILVAPGTGQKVSVSFS